MPGDAGPDLLQSIANIGSRGHGQRVPSVLRFPQHARLQTVDDPGPPQRRPHNISGRLKRKAVAPEADKTRPHRDFRLALARLELRLVFGLVAARLLRRKCRVYRKPPCACSSEVSQDQWLAVTPFCARKPVDFRTGAT